jgi:micrococcal nuclease
MTEWSVPARVERVVDGDTVDMTLDLGWKITYRTRCRLTGVNTPEMNTPEGVSARTFVAELLPVGTEVRFISKALDKYGRPLGRIITPAGVDLGELLLAKGLAVTMKA